MSTTLDDASLDAILALQVTVGWAGEGRCSPQRLGWWDTDLVDPDGGGDFLTRLLPQTHAWASLEAVREAGRRTDAKARAKLANPDRVRTIFFLGFELDERLGDRLGLLKRSGTPPREALPLPVDLHPSSATFDSQALATALGAGDIPYTVVPGARELNGDLPDAPEKMIRRLAAALAPFGEQYPLPFFNLRS